MLKFDDKLVLACSGRTLTGFNTKEELDDYLKKSKQYMKMLEYHNLPLFCMLNEDQYGETQTYGCRPGRLHQTLVDAGFVVLKEWRNEMHKRNVRIYCKG